MLLDVHLRGYGPGSRAEDHHQDSCCKGQAGDCRKLRLLILIALFGFGDAMGHLDMEFERHRPANLSESALNRYTNSYKRHVSIRPAASSMPQL